MFSNVDFYAVARASAAGFVVAIVWFGVIDGWWRRDQNRPLSTWVGQMSLRVLVTALASGFAGFMLYQLLLEVLGAEDPKAGLSVAGLIWVGFTVPFLLVAAVSSGASIRRFLTDALGALLVLAAIGWVTGLGGGPYR